MAGDIGIREQILILPKTRATRSGAPEMRSLSRSGGRIMHQYGDRVLLAEMPAGAEASMEFEGLESPAA